MNRAADDLISRKQAIKEILALCPKETKPDSLDEYGATILYGIVDVILKRLPVVDAVPVVHGTWEVLEDCGITRCSACKWNFEGCIDYKYCPNCGAKMETTKIGAKDE